MPEPGLVQKNPLLWRIPGKCSVLLPFRVCGQSHASEPLGTQHSSWLPESRGTAPTLSSLACSLGLWLGQFKPGPKGLS